MGRQVASALADLSSESEKDVTLTPPVRATPTCAEAGGAVARSRIDAAVARMARRAAAGSLVLIPDEVDPDARRSERATSGGEGSCFALFVSLRMKGADVSLHTSTDTPPDTCWCQGKFWGGKPALAVSASEKGYLLDSVPTCAYSLESADEAGLVHEHRGASGDPLSLRLRVCDPRGGGPLRSGRVGRRAGARADRSYLTVRG